LGLQWIEQALFDRRIAELVFTFSLDDPSAETVLKRTVTVCPETICHPAVHAVVGRAQGAEGCQLQIWCECLRREGGSQKLCTKKRVHRRKRTEENGSESSIL